jgi:hypothetical protein
MITHRKEENLRVLTRKVASRSGEQRPSTISFVLLSPLQNSQVSLLRIAANLKHIDCDRRVTSS